MGVSKPLIRILTILVVVISISWYGKLGHEYEEIETGTYDYPISYETAKKTLVHPIYRTKKYYYNNISVTRYTRTLIPFKYKKGEVEVKRQYYNQNK